ncbi:MAG TPA: DUF6159 family protein [Gemmatimonadaceae bacterium]|nr:DUF6159 family protein [Gemmatimonadaceae bacterium]
MERIRRSFRLIERSYQILMQDKELMVLPLLSGVFITLAIVGVILGFGFSTDTFEQDRGTAYLPIFVMYVVTYTIGIFFQSAVVAGATERMRGGDPTLRSALGAAWSRIGAILGWALFAATVGMLLKFIEDRVGFLGKIVTRLAGVAWSLATFFIVPVLVLEDHPVDESFTRSASLFRQTWGETFAGGAGIGIIAVFAWIALAIVVFLLVSIGALIPALVAGVVGAVTIAAFTSALQGVYVASLYRYATAGHETSGFDEDLLAQAFVPKR